MKSLLRIGIQFHVFLVLDAPQCGQAGLGFLNGFGAFHLLLKGGLLCPVIEAPDALVTEANAAMMRMVMLLPLDCLHGISTRHRLASRAIYRPEVWLVGPIHDILGNGLAIVSDLEVFPTRFGDLKFGGGS